MTTPILIKAKPLIEAQKQSLSNACSRLKRAPKMVVALVGDNSASQVYVGHKKRFCNEIGAECEIKKFSVAIEESEFLNEINKINADDLVDGLIIQLPLPKQLEHLNVSELVNPAKDIDGFHFENTKEIYNNQINENSLLPCTPKGILKLLDFYKIEISGKNIVVLGRSLIVGKPLGLLLMNRNATVTFCHSKTQDLKTFTRNADILIVAMGKSEFIDESFLSKGQVIIDVGIHKRSDGKLCGDVNFDSALKAEPRAITPVPGGVGPLTVLSLIENLLITAKRKK